MLNDLHGVRLVLLGPHEGDPVAPAVLVDRRWGSEEAVAHLIAGGRRRIAHIGGDPRRGTSGRKLEGYRTALLRGGLEVDPALHVVEPVPPQDVEGLAAVAARVDVPIATGENEQTVYAFRDLLVRRAADVLMPNVAKTGLTECARIGDLALAFNARIAPHGVGSGLAIAAALQGRGKGYRR